MTRFRLTSDNQPVVFYTGTVGADSQVYGRGVQAPLMGHGVVSIAAVVPEPHIANMHLLLFVVYNWQLHYIYPQLG